MWAGMEPGFEPGGVKHEPKKFQVTWFIKKKKKKKNDRQYEPKKLKVTI